MARPIIDHHRVRDWSPVLALSGSILMVLIPNPSKPQWSPYPLLCPSLLPSPLSARTFAPHAHCSMSSSIQTLEQLQLNNYGSRESFTLVVNGHFSMIDRFSGNHDCNQLRLL